MENGGDVGGGDDGDDGDGGKEAQAESQRLDARTSSPLFSLVARLPPSVVAPSVLATAAMTTEIYCVQFDCAMVWVCLGYYST